MALTLREREFVLSAVTQGATPAWNIRKHMLPNVLPQMLIVGAYELGAIIVLEAALSYLGLGVQPPLPSWGLMISEGQNHLETDPWLCILPGIALFMLVAGVQFLSQALSPERRGRAPPLLTHLTQACMSAQPASPFRSRPGRGSVVAGQAGPPDRRRLVRCRGQ